MHVLDRYIVRQFLTNFVILLVVILSLIVLVDFLAGMDEFVQAGEAHADAYGGFMPAFLWITIDFYAPLLLRIYVMIAGLLIVAAMGFTFAAMARQRELVALLTTGVSLHRVAAPVLMVGFVLALTTLPIQEYALPPLAEKLVRDKPQLKRDDIFERRPLRYVEDGHGLLLSADEFVPGTTGQPRLEGQIAIIERDPSGRAMRRITASQAVWDPQRSGWQLVGAYAIRPQYEPQQDAWADGPQAEAVDFLATNLTPQVLFARQASAYPRLLSIHQLMDLTHNISMDRAALWHIIHGRFAAVVVTLLVMVVGLPFLLLREPAAVTLGVLKAAGLCLTAWGVGLVLGMYPVIDTNPVASAWLPVILLMPCAALTAQMVRT
jgi:lipopolysaccharide export system permease protein